MPKTFTTVKVKTKPYVKHYLQHHFGDPVKLPAGNFINKLLSYLLQKPVKHDNQACKTYTTTCEISLSEATFKRFGFGLTKTCTKDFNVAIENYIRSQIRSIAEGIYNNNTGTLEWKVKYLQLEKLHTKLLTINANNLTSDKVKELKKLHAKLNARVKTTRKDKIDMEDALMIAAYDILGFDEQILPYETIKKDFYRYKTRER